MADNCELEHNMSSSNMTEKTLRELYLRGFEIAVKEARPMTVMAAYNKVNACIEDDSPEYGDREQIIHKTGGIYEENHFI